MVTAVNGVSASDLSLVLNTLFRHRVIVYHNSMMRQPDYLLTKLEATKYIVNHFFYLYSEHDPLEILSFFKADDGVSYFEIRTPRNSDEFKERIDDIEYSSSTILWLPNSSTNITLRSSLTLNITPHEVNTTT